LSSQVTTAGGHYTRLFIAVLYIPLIRRLAIRGQKIQQLLPAFDTHLHRSIPLRVFKAPVMGLVNAGNKFRA
jgi:hypothetical protein